ncbi:MAG: hypothetical protein K0Q51_1040 [Rickettsiaceae bacterium]|jgi:SH3-like domain-containing protein|nr:hypothetical protein [Rickettsiaceae bacterium]
MGNYKVFFQQIFKFISKNLAIISLFLFCLYTNISFSDNKLPIPRFASIKSNEVNARTGPSNRYPIEWVFIKKGEPVEIFAEFEQWRRIRDITGEGGWVHSSMLSGKRFVIVKGDEPQLLYKKPTTNSVVLAKVAPEVRCELFKCQDKLCSVKCGDYKGWIAQNMLWGAYPEEKW